MTVPRTRIAGYSEYTQYDNGFFAILGSDLGGSTARMILDHKKEIGYRTVERLVIFGKKDEGDGNDKGKSLMMLLSGCRQRPTKIRSRGP